MPALAAAPNGASYIFVSFCALSLALGALIYNLMSNLSLFNWLNRSYEEQEVRSQCPVNQQSPSLSDTCTDPYDLCMAVIVFKLISPTCIYITLAFPL